MNGRKIPIIDLKGQYATTLNRNLALHNNYIGEVPIRPKVLEQAMGLIFGREFFAGTIYYYGTPDEELKKKFYHS